WRGMLLVGGRETGKPSRLAWIVRALALPDGIECQYHIPELYEPLAAALVGHSPLSVGTVSHLEKDARMRPPLLRQIKVCRNNKARPAFVHELFDAVSFSFEGAHRARVQRCPLRKGAGEFQERLARPRLIRPNGRRRGERRNARGALAICIQRQHPN